MTIVDKLKAEEDNYLTITVYGNRSIFAYAYERSAYAFVKAVRGFKAKTLHNGDLNFNYITIGIPADKVEKYLRGKYPVKVDHPEDGMTIFVAQLPEHLFSEEEFQQWKSKVMQENKKKKISTPAVRPNDQTLSDSVPEAPANLPIPLTLNTIIQDVLEQQLNEYTPMMAFNYLSQLQKRLRNARI